MTNATDVAGHSPVLPEAATPNRRTFLAHAAAGAAAIAVTASPAASAAADPIYAAIQAHHAAVIALGLVVDWHSELDHELPIEKCRSSVTAWDEEIVATDDPRWIDCQRALMAAFDRETNAAIELVSVRPTTAAGVVDLLKYAIAADTDGKLWPNLSPDEDSKTTRSWHHFLIANLVEVLPKLVRA